MMSMPVPGASGTTSVIVRDGKSWADAGGRQQRQSAEQQSDQPGHRDPPCNRRSRKSVSIAPRAVDQVIQRQAALEPLDLRDDMRREHARRNIAGVVRRDRDLGMAHSGLCGGKRLLREHVERRAGERAFIQRRDDVGIDLQRPRARR